MQVFCSEKFLRGIAERVIVSEAGACTLVVDQLARQKPRSEGPVQPKSALSSLFAMALENMAGQLESEVSRT